MREISWSSGLPFKAVLFEFLINPVLSESDPGVAIPTEPVALISRSTVNTNSAIAFSVQS